MCFNFNWEKTSRCLDHTIALLIKRKSAIDSNYNDIIYLIFFFLFLTHHFLQCTWLSRKNCFGYLPEGRVSIFHSDKLKFSTKMLKTAKNFFFKVESFPGNVPKKPDCGFVTSKLKSHSSVGGKAPRRFKHKDSSSWFGVTASSIDATWHQWIVCRTFVFSELSPHDTFHQSVTGGSENTRKKSSFRSTWFRRLRWSLPFICECRKIRTSGGSWQRDSARRVSGKWMGAATDSYLHGCHNCTIVVIPIISMNSLCGFYVCITFAFVSV